MVIDKPSGHFPNRIEIEIHTDAKNLTSSIRLSVPLFLDGKSVWCQGIDAGGEIEVAVIELDRTALPQSVVLRCFTPAHLQRSLQEVEVGTSLLIVGFPLGFHDALHHLPVVRHAVIASSFGLRFQGLGYFLTDARTYRGTSGAPVVMHSPSLYAPAEQPPAPSQPTPQPQLIAPGLMPADQAPPPAPAEMITVAPGPDDYWTPGYTIITPPGSPRHVPIKPNQP